MELSSHSPRRVTLVITARGGTEKLKRCLAAASAQTFEDLELLAVDAGTQGGSSGVLKSWQEQEPRAVVCRIESASLAAARNAGLDRATGDFILFVDGKDYLVPDAVSECMSCLSERPAQILCFGRRIVDRTEEERTSVFPDIDTIFARGEQVQSELLPKIIGYDPDRGVKTAMRLLPAYAMISMDLIRRLDWRFEEDGEIPDGEQLSLLSLFKDVSAVGIHCNDCYCESAGEEGTADAVELYRRLSAHHDRMLQRYRDIGYPYSVGRAIRAMYLCGTGDVLRVLQKSDLSLPQKLRAMNTIAGDEKLKATIREVKRDPEVDPDAFFQMAFGGSPFLKLIRRIR